MFVVSVEPVYCLLCLDNIPAVSVVLGVERAVGGLAF